MTFFKLRREGLMEKIIFIVMLGLSTLLHGAQDYYVVPQEKSQTTFQEGISFEQYAKENSIELKFDKKKDRYVLDLSGKKLTDVKGILDYKFSLEGKETTLKELKDSLVINLANNNFASFPPELITIYVLRDLNLSGNQIIELPKNIHKMWPLHRLNLNNNQLRSLPASLAETGIDKLFLSHNQLTELPQEFCDSKLEILDLSHNQLTELPEKFGEIAFLEKLNLSNNQLQSLPASLSNLGFLKELILSDNQLQTFPVEIGDRRWLKKLDLSNNQIASLHDAMGLLNNINIEELFLGGNPLTAWPDFKSLKNLRRLSLNNINLVVTHGIPDSIIAWLKELELDNNQLTTFPNGLDRFYALTHLSMKGNRISSLPNTMNIMGCVRHLFLDDNEMQAVPLSLKKFKKLLTLSLHGNRLTALPDDFFRYMVFLRTLDLSNNPELAVLPAGLFKLKHLDGLNVAGDPLIQLPHQYLR